MSAAAVEPQDRDRPVDRVVTWLLFAVMLVGYVVLAGMAIFGVFATDSCGSTDNDPLVCNGSYLFTLILGLWALLLVGLVVVLWRIVRAIRGETRSWHWPILGAVWAGLSFAAFVMLLFVGA